MLSLIALAVIASPSAMAQDSGWHLGANIGRSHSTIDHARIADGLMEGGFQLATLKDDDRDMGFKIFGGYAFNRYWSLEAGYFDLGKFGFDATTYPAGTLAGTIKLRGVNLDLVLNLPVTRRFSVFGRVGANHAEARDTFRGTGAVHALDPDPSRRGTSLKVGAGLQYDFTRAVGMRLETERYRVTDAVGHMGDIDLVSVGLLVRFGRQAPAAAPMEPTRPEPVATAVPVPEPAPAPMAAPILVVVPVAVATQQYCTILDIQFEIDEDEIQREEKEKIGVLATFLTKYPETTAVIEGHSDSVGSLEHNMDLSRRRAESVVAYLVETCRIAPSRLSAVGYGPTRPLTDSRSEEGLRENRRINAVIGCVTDIEGLLVVPARVTMALLIEFDRNDAKVKAEYHEELARVAKFLKANPRVTATVEGHTGNLQGTSQLAMEISVLRARNVVDYLVDTFGIERSRLTAEGFGRGRRFAYNTSVEGQQENRRVNIIINYPKAKK